MAIPLDSDFLARAVTSDRWSVATRTGLSAEAFATWDPKILRKPRLIVPVDVQALYVPVGSDEEFVQLPGAITTPDDEDAAPAPAPLEPGKARPAGVHLHWAMPDSIMRGTMRESEDDVLDLAALPDRWLLLRILAPNGADRTHVQGWVIEADTTRVVALADWREGTDAGSTPTGKTLSGRDLNAGAGGSLSWTASYDAALNRFAIHDPLDDLGEAAANGSFNDAATYLVAGWWSRAAEDPLDAARSARGFAQVVESLGWRVGADTSGQTAYVDTAEQIAAARSRFGIDSASRFAIVPTSGTLTNSTALAGAAGQQLFLPEGGRFVATPPRHVYSTLLHGVVHGVPVTGEIPADNRPTPSRVGVALAGQVEDAVAALTAAGIGSEGSDSRRDTERLIAALSSDLVGKLAEANGAVEIEEREHAANFGAIPGGDHSIERIMDRGGPEDLVAGRAARNRAGVPARETASKTLTTKLTWSATKPGLIALAEDDLRVASSVFEKKGRPAAQERARNVQRPGPRFYLPLEPVIAIRNSKRSLRHGCDGRASPDETLTCRWPSQVATSIPGGISGPELLGSFAYGAIPQEVVRLAQNAIITDPYAGPWVAENAAKSSGLPRATLLARVKAETALRFSKGGVYDGTVPGFSTVDGIAPGPKEAALGNQLRRHSLIEGVDAAPIGVTVWAQPWSPVWLEWEVELDLSDRLTGWFLGQVDYETEDVPQGGTQRTIRGRSPISAGAARTLAATIGNWIEAEDLRDIDGEGEASEDTERDVATLKRHLACADMISVSLTGIHDALLGLPEAPDGRVEETGKRIVPVDLPVLLFSGRMRLSRARIVDAFGRLLEMDPQRVTHPAAHALEQPSGLRLSPRLSRPTRLSFRLADPGDPAALPREATVNQERPDLMVNPVSGFLLPDLIDEALEVFDASGSPLGQLMHEPISGGVMWEIAPGREGPADSGPLHDLGPAQLPLGRFAAAMVEADSRARQGAALAAGAETALSAFLRAVDTTLWSIDAFASLGTPHIAGLVGRPMAMVRATLRLQIKDDLAELDLSAPGALEARRAVYEDLADRAFTVRIGEFTRDDDGVYGYFVNDDYARFHLVDKLVRDRAVEAGRRRGHFGLLGQTAKVPEVRPIDHRYILAEDELAIHAGEVLRLTILMHPSGKVHLTSGILPRKSLQLARDWVDPGLARMAPSARIGPVMIDPDKVRLPRIASFGEDQTWTRRDTPFTWKDDPILAATQTALLPDAPAGIEEGYIRIAATSRLPEEGGR